MKNFLNIDYLKNSIKYKLVLANVSSIVENKRKTKLKIKYIPQWKPRK